MQFSLAAINKFVDHRHILLANEVAITSVKSLFSWSENIRSVINDTKDALASLTNTFVGCQNWNFGGGWAKRIVRPDSKLENRKIQLSI